MRLLRSALLGLAVVGATALSFATPAEAQRRVDGEVLIILASDVGSIVDPRIAEVPALRRPPFDQYSSMALLSSPALHLTIGEPEEIALPNGRRIRIVLREITAAGRFRVRVSINRPGQQDYLPEMSVVASPGDPFFVAGQSFQSGTLVIGVRLRRP